MTSKIIEYVCPACELSNEIDSYNKSNAVCIFCDFEIKYIGEVNNNTVWCVVYKDKEPPSYNVKKITIGNQRQAVSDIYYLLYMNGTPYLLVGVNYYFTASTPL